MTSNKKIDICEPIDQLRLYGYEDYFISFKSLYEKNKLPNAILLSGQKGIGKSTFIYHFINYLLSQSEKDKYSLENFTINKNNSSFKLIQNHVHPNFFLLINGGLKSIVNKRKKNISAIVNPKDLNTKINYFCL